MKKPQIEESWLNVLYATFQQPFMQDLRAFLVEEKKSHPVYPKGEEIFAAFNLTPFHDVRVLILGQDPYHGRGQAHGLSFSVPDGVKPPPSLQNILKEREHDLGIPIPTGGNLTPWAQRGVLLLNSVLTVRHRTANSHQNRGWEQFTDAAIRNLSQQRENIVFILWGRKAQSKRTLINTKKHHIIASPHPSPYSAEFGFFGSRPFSKCNAFLERRGLEGMDWSL